MSTVYANCILQPALVAADKCEHRFLANLLSRLEI